MSGAFSVLFSKGRALILNPFLRLEHLCDRELRILKAPGCGKLNLREL